jgi:hypothetical protein
MEYQFRPPVLHRVISIARTAIANNYIVMCDITDIHGRTYEAPYWLMPEDPHGLAPELRQWMLDHADFPIAAYVPPTMEEIRRNTRRIGRTTFRLNMKAQGVTTAKIEDFLAGIADPDAREDMQIQWEGVHFGRLDPFVAALAAATGLSEEQLDVVFKVEV